VIPITASEIAERDGIALATAKTGRGLIALRDGSIAVKD
jgi:hypothetical protein